MNKTVIAVIVVVVVVVVAVIVFSSGGQPTGETPPSGGAVTMPAGGTATGHQPRERMPKMSDQDLEELANNVPKEAWSKLPEWQRKQLEEWAAAHGK